MKGKPLFQSRLDYQQTILIDETNVELDKVISIVRSQIKRIVEAQPKATEGCKKVTRRSGTNANIINPLLVAVLSEQIRMLSSGSEDFQNRLDNFELFL